MESSEEFSKQKGKERPREQIAMVDRPEAAALLMESPIMQPMPVAVDNTVPAFHIIHFARSNPTRAGHGLFWADPCSAQQQRQRGRAGKRKAVK
jgi:hypothetical protein